jgi:hypothetical protein
MTLHDLADDKGFFVYQMLRETIGDAAFKRGLRRAVATHAGTVIHLADLRKFWEAESGRDLGWFFDQWFGRSGVPEFRLRYDVTPNPAGGFAITGTVTQLGPLYRVSADVALARAGRAPRVEVVPISGRATTFRFRAKERPDTVLFDPTYRILRWTDEYRQAALLRKARDLHGRGADDSAAVALAEFLERAPTSMAGHGYAGAWRLEAGDLEAAEREFRWVSDRARIDDADDPAVTRSRIGLGKICDLRKRRDDALDWYREALSGPDEQDLRAEATALLTTPYQIRPKADPALLDRCVGAYAMVPGLVVTVTLRPSGILTASTSYGQSFGLEWSEGATFRAAGNGSVVLRFAGGDARFTDLTLDAPGRVFHLKRKQE